MFHVIYWLACLATVIYLFIFNLQVVKAAVCGGLCPYELKQVRGCNRYCYNGGSLGQTRCKCSPQYGGQCCQQGLPFNLLSLNLRFF